MYRKAAERKVTAAVGKQRFEQLVRKARRVNAERDRIDRKNGRAAPPDCPPGVHIRTVMAALESGMKTGDWPCVAEGYAMLEQYLDRLPIRDLGLAEDGKGPIC
jgi:hypothetical protein